MASSILNLNYVHVSISIISLTYLETWDKTSSSLAVIISVIPV